MKNKRTFTPKYNHGNYRLKMWWPDYSLSWKILQVLSIQINQSKARTKWIQKISFISKSFYFSLSNETQEELWTMQFHKTPAFPLIHQPMMVSKIQSPTHASKHKKIPSEFKMKDHPSKQNNTKGRDNPRIYLFFLLKPCSHWGKWKNTKGAYKNHVPKKGSQSNH